MTTAEILERLREGYEEVLLADGFEDALLGVVIGACREAVACYDYEECVRILVARSDGRMDAETAAEYLDFNTIGAYVGEYTPLFLVNWRKEGEGSGDV